MSASLRRLIRKKQRLYNVTKRYNSNTIWREYKHIRQNVRNLMRQQHTSYLSNALFSDDTNGKKFFWSGDTLKIRRKTIEPLLVLNPKLAA